MIAAITASTEPPDFSGGMPHLNIGRPVPPVASTEPPDFSGGMEKQQETLRSAYELQRSRLISQAECRESATIGKTQRLGFNGAA